MNMSKVSMPENFCFKIKDFQSNVTQSFRNLRSEEDFHDVTLVTDDKTQVSAHKVVLAASSDYFKTILKQNKHTHPLLCLEGVSSTEINSILNYIYNGEIQIIQENLDRFLKVAQRLQLEGISHPIGEEHEQSIDETESNISLEAANTENQDETFIDFTEDPLQVLNDGDDAVNEEIDRRLEKLLRNESGGCLICKACGKKFKYRPPAIRHAECHATGLSFPCEICGRAYRSRNSRKSHITHEHKQKPQVRPPLRYLLPSSASGPFTLIQTNFALTQKSEYHAPKNEIRPDGGHSGV